MQSRKILLLRKSVRQKGSDMRSTWGQITFCLRTIFDRLLQNAAELGFPRGLRWVGLGWFIHIYTDSILQSQPATSRQVDTNGTNWVQGWWGEKKGVANRLGE